MQTYEVTALLQHKDRKVREQWEMTRLLGYIVAQCNSKKRLQLKDIVKFPWDNEGKESGCSDAPSKEQVEALMQLAKQYEHDNITE